MPAPFAFRVCAYTTGKEEEEEEVPKFIPGGRLQKDGNMAPPPDAGARSPSILLFWRKSSQYEERWATSGSSELQGNDVSQHCNALAALLPNFNGPCLHP